MIFLKTDNLISGRYFAEITSEVFRGYERAKYIYAEPRLSIYGRKQNEWSKLGNWVVTHKVYSDQVRFFVQIPRLYNVYREANEISCFADMLRNIFLPLFEVTVNPNVDWKLHLFLQQLVGFDSVDDESKTEFMWKDAAPTATEWVSAQNPPYSYYLYYLQANLKCLNQLREARGFRTFALRPHSGEAGPTNHLAAAFLVAENISHGITLRKAPVLQYLYYLTNIGVSVSPISNNKLFLEFSRSPFLAYFKQGLNVTLTTDDPLQFHLSEHPLIEEYSTAMHVFKLSPHDICEIARNSVLISGFEVETCNLLVGFFDHFLCSTQSSSRGWGPSTSCGGRWETIRCSPTCPTFGYGIARRPLWPRLTLFCEIQSCPRRQSATTRT